MGNTNIALGWHVWASGGEPLGRVTRFIVDSTTGRLDALAVDRGPLSTERLVDLALVDRAAHDEVFLSVADDEAAHLPPFTTREVTDVRESSLVAPAVAGTYQALAGSPWDPYEGEGVGELRDDSLYATPLPAGAVVETISSIPESSIVLGRRTAIVSADGFTAGHLHALTIDEQRRIDDVVVTAGLVYKHHVRLPVSSIAGLTHDRIVLTQGLDAALDSVEEADVTPAPPRPLPRPRRKTVAAERRSAIETNHT
jgi:hypothetical protein